jgi:hypothetical protein
MVDISQLQTDAGASVNGKWVDIPGFEGLRCRIAHFRVAAWIDWLEETRDEYDDEDERERAFYGAKIVREVEGLEQDGQPVKWTQETGAKLMTEHQAVEDEQTGETVRVYPLDAFFFWVKHYANDLGNYAAKLAGN